MTRTTLTTSLPLALAACGSPQGGDATLDADIVAGTAYVLDLRFDLDHNLVLTGHGWQLTPVLQVESLDEGGDDDTGAEDSRG